MAVGKSGGGLASSDLCCGPRADLWNDDRNRKPPAGYRLSRVAFARGFPTASKSSVDAEQPLLWNADSTKCPQQCFRPVGLAFDGPGKRLFMTSDATGELWMVTGV